MLTELAIVGFILFIGRLAKWIIDPYLAWKKNYQARGYERLKMTTADKNTYDINQYRKMVENRKVHLSLIVPSYNEQQRLPVMLDETMEYLKQKNISYEIIIVNDGSKDATSQVALDYAVKNNVNMTLVEYPKNRGKGGAVRAGMQISVGQYHLMVDADGATEFKDLGKLTTKMEQLIKSTGSRLLMVAGSRHHLTTNEELQLNRKWYRKLFSGVLNFILVYICGITINDTQCGFKLMTREASKIMFETLHVERWSFDIELFIIANKYGITCSEIPVNWEDVEGSKLNVFEASISMFRDILLIKAFYLLGLWKYNDKALVQ